ncbi:MAG: hypothetical protein JST00_39995 [Deltaproteobacteria bacterium]|nr:hypothetical protein [Deltaproteobacteria bacterium]
MIRRTRDRAPKILVIAAASVAHLSAPAHADPPRAGLQPSRAELAIDAAAYAASRRPYLQSVDRFAESSNVRHNALGLALELRREPPPNEHGFVARLGGAVEMRTDCEEGRPCPFTRTDDGALRDASGAFLPPTHSESALRARVGYWFRHVELEAGLLFTHTTPPTFVSFPWPTVIVHTPRVDVWPDLVLKLRYAGASLAMGFGSSTMATFLTPGLFLQLGYSPDRRLSAAFTASVQGVKTGYEGLGLEGSTSRGSLGTNRMDLEVWLALGGKVRLGPGFGVVWRGTGPRVRVGGDFRMQVTVRF